MKHMVVVIITMLVICGAYYISCIGVEDIERWIGRERIGSSVSEASSINSKEKGVDVSYVETKDKYQKNMLEKNIKVTYLDKKSKKIRVILKTSDYSSIKHSYITVNSKNKYKINGKEYVPNKNITIKPNSKLFEKSGCIIVKGEGISLPSIKRGTVGLPYKGIIEIYKEGKSLVVVNEVDIEDYLYSVVPSEMPESFHIEALKAQSICARTYAIEKIQNRDKGVYKKYKADVDDSVSYQVYNNQKYSDITVKAVNATKGQVMTYKGKAIKAFFYSTSSGKSSKSGDVFGGENLPYIKEKLHVISNKSTKVEYIEKDCEWFKWYMKIDVDKLGKSIEDYLYKKNKLGTANNIKLYSKDKKKYITSKVYSIGKIKDIKVRTKKSSGIVNEIVISGSKSRIIVSNQYTIRQILAVKGSTIVNNKKNIKSMTMLPSAFFDISKQGDYVVIKGRGFGHGVGMSQWGAHMLAKKGHTYDSILRYYFSDIDIY